MERLTATIVAIMTASFVFQLATSRPTQANQRAKATRRPLSLPEAIKQVSPSIVQVTYLFDHLPAATRAVVGSPFLIGALGTGFLVNDDGYVITAKHVIDASGDLRLTAPDGQELEVGRKRVGIGIPGPNTPNVRGTFSVFAYELVDVDSIHDLALLKIQRSTMISSYVGVAIIKGGQPQSIPTVQPQAAAKLSLTRPEEGQPIAVSGYPLRKSVLITTSGAVASSWDYDVKEAQLPGAPDWFRLPNIADSYLADMHVNPGNSGGPVYSLENGAVIGVCVAFDVADVRYGDGKKEPVTFQGRPLTYNSGVSVLVPIQYVIEILQKHSLKWSEVER